MKTRTLDNLKLGLFVLAGVLFLIFSLYMIGRNRNLFGASFTVSANFRNVNGLTVGNNVRFSGIDVGTVQKIEIMSDTLVRVTMVLEKNVRKFIKKNAIASVGTDGLMGNKLININSPNEPSPPVEGGDVLVSLRPIEGDEMLRTLNTTNENMAVISEDLRRITQRINNSNALWKMITDTSVLHDLRDAGQNLKHASAKIAESGDQASELLRNVQHGKGLAGALLSDSVMAMKLKSAVTNVEEASKKSTVLATNLNDILLQVKSGKGAAGALVADTALEHKLRSTLGNIDQASQRLNENMEAMRHNFLFKGYFKDQEKEAKKNKK